MNQKDIELQKMREKLFKIANQDRANSISSNIQHKHSLSVLKQGEIINSISNKQIHKTAPGDQSFNSNETPDNKATRTSNISGNIGKSPMKSSISSTTSPTQQHVYMTEAIAALELQRNELLNENKELHRQVVNLSNEIKNIMNNNSEKLKNKKQMKSHLRNNNNTGYLDEKDTEDSDNCEEVFVSSVDDASDPNNNQSEDVKGKHALWEAIKDQKLQLKQWEHKYMTLDVANHELEQTITIMRNRNNELREEVINLRLELESRPTVKQYNELQRSVKELEEKLHDVIMMRKEAVELNAWRKHLSTSERIKIDKRNHELGLWLIDSLPKAVIKDVLQNVCRELNINDVSEVQPALVKLKTTIKLVPRMEKFITNVCSYVFERQLPILPPSMNERLGVLNDNEGQPASRSDVVMEDVLPVLRSWWHNVQYLDELKMLEDMLLKELHRREHLLGQMDRLANQTVETRLNTITSMDEKKSYSLNPSIAQTVGRLQEVSDEEKAWNSYGQIQWSKRDRTKAIEIIHELIDFQLEALSYKQSLVAAEAYIRDNPEVLVNRLIAHLKYLFAINRFDSFIN